MEAHSPGAEAVLTGAGLRAALQAAGRLTVVLRGTWDERWEAACAAVEGLGRVAGAAPGP